MTIAIKITLIEDEGQANTPSVDVSYIYASTRQPHEEQHVLLSPACREVVVHATELRDIRISHHYRKLP